MKLLLLILITWVLLDIYKRIRKIEDWVDSQKNNNEKKEVVDELD